MLGRLRRWLNLRYRSESTSQHALIAALAREQELADVYASLGKTVVDLAQANDELEREISVRRRAEMALRESEERYREAAHTAEAASQAKSQFLSRMSHNLRTPLNSVLGFAQLLQMGDLSDQQRESVEYILIAGRHLLGMINEALDLSWIETGGLQLTIEPFRLTDLLSESLDFVRPALIERRLGLRLDTSAAHDRFVLADRQRLKQVILNLLSNAIKYNRAGGAIWLDCTVTRHDRIRVRVSDNGPGIAPEHMARLFTPFDRLGAEESGIEGTGLGLVLSRGLVEAMGGTIGAESRVGQGSTFWFEIPLVDRAPIVQHHQGLSNLLACECEHMV